MKPMMVKRSTLTETRLPFKPSILARPELKVKEQILKALKTYK
jgi:hypothetical protein